MLNAKIKIRIAFSLQLLAFSICLSAADNLNITNYPTVTSVGSNDWVLLSKSGPSARTRNVPFFDLFRSGLSPTQFNTAQFPFTLTNLPTGGESNTASSIGGAPVFKQKSGVDLQFRGLTVSGLLSLGTNANDLVINNTAVAVVAGANVTLTTNGNLVTINAASNSPAAFVSYNYDVIYNTSGVTGISQIVANTNHGLGLTPGFIRWVLVCVSNCPGYSVGDELDATSVYNAGANPAQSFASFANATKVALYQQGLDYFNTYLVSGTNSDFATETLIPSDWKAKCYARP